MGPRIHGLYVIIDPAACAGRSPVDVARLALEGGASVIQWRDKIRPKGDQLSDANAIRALCTTHGALFIVNDHADLALAVRADGVHLGQHDLAVEDVRAMVGDAMIIGASTNNVSEAARAVSLGADYVAVGSIFPSHTKIDTRPASLGLLREVRQSVDVPVVAIGGVTAENITAVTASGASAVAVISAVCGAPDPQAAAAALASAISSTRDRAITPERIRAIVHSYVAAVNNRDREAYLALFAEDGIREDPPDGRTLIGRDAIGEWWDGVHSRNREFTINVRNVVVVRQEAALYWVIEHQHDPGEFAAASGIEILSVEDSGEIASARSYWGRNVVPGSDTLAVAEATIAALNDKDCDAYTALWARDGMWQAPLGAMPTIGIDNIRASCAAMMHATDFSVALEAICVSGTEAALAWTSTVRGRRRSRVVSGVDVISLDAENHIASLHSYWEPEAHQQQSSARP